MSLLKNDFVYRCVQGLSTITSVSVLFFANHSQALFVLGLRACLQGGRVILASGSILDGGQKIARVNKQNFRGSRITLQPGTT